MRTVAERSVIGLLTLAQMSRLGFLSGEDVRNEIGALMSSVTKWLRVRKTACAERILFAFFKLDSFGLGRRNFWFIHRLVIP